MTITEGAGRVGNIVDALATPTALRVARSIANAFFESEVPGNSIGVPECATGGGSVGIACHGRHGLGRCAHGAQTDW